MKKKKEVKTFVDGEEEDVPVSEPELVEEPEPVEEGPRVVVQFYLHQLFTVYEDGSVKVVRV